MLTSILPPRVRDQVKPLLRKQESDFTNVMPYKVLKTQLIKIFKPPQENDFERAMTRVLSDKPSTLARDLVNDLCSHELVGCCCSKFIVGLWKRQLPLSCRQGIASMEFSAANFDNIVKHADDIFFQNKAASQDTLIAKQSQKGPA